MEELSPLLSEAVHSTQSPSRPSSSSYLAVSEQLRLVAVANSLRVDLYDLEVLTPEPGLRSCRFVTSVRVLEAGAVVEVAFDPHDPELLVAGTSDGSVVLVRVRRLASPVDGIRPAIAHKVLSKRLCDEGAGGPAGGVGSIRFHPKQPGIFAALYSGRVMLLQYGVGVLAQAACCTSACAYRAISWCGDFLACGADDGRVTVWSVRPRNGDPASPALRLEVDSETVCILDAPGADAPDTDADADAAPSVAGAAPSVTALQWAQVGCGDEGGPEAPLGVLFCAHTNAPRANAILRAWSVHASGRWQLEATLPSPVGAIIGSISAPLLSHELPAAAHSASEPHGEPTSQEGLLGTTPFDASCRRWVMCASPGEQAVFALPFGRESEAVDAPLLFPTAVQMLRVPSLTPDAPRDLELEVDPTRDVSNDGQPSPDTPCGTRGLHRVTDVGTKKSILGALARSAEHPAATELVLVLSERALHFVGFGGAPDDGPTVAAHESAAQLSSEEAPPADALSAPHSPPAAAPMKPPLISHLLPAAPRRRDATAASAAASMAHDAQQSAQAHASTDPPSATPPSETAALRARIHALEERARSAESQLATLRSSFSLYAATSRMQTNELLERLERLTAAEPAARAPVVEPIALSPIKGELS